MDVVGSRMKLIALGFVFSSICFAGELGSDQDVAPEVPAEEAEAQENTMPSAAAPQMEVKETSSAATPQEPVSEPVAEEPMRAQEKAAAPEQTPQEEPTMSMPASVEPVSAPEQESETPAPTLPVSQPQPAVTPAPTVQPQPVVMPARVMPKAAMPQKAPAPQAKPEVKKPEVQQAPELAIEDEEIVGIDTVDLEEPQGNWLFKRLWWERAEEKYEEIRALEAQVLELRMPFFMKRTEVDRTILDPFYLHVAKDRGALEVLLADISDFLASEEMQEGALNEEERGMRDQLQAERETLEQLQKNIQAILNHDHELDAAISTLMEQLSRVSEYEREAWNYFKEIGRVLNDNKAREYVLKMKNIYRNIKEIQEYIEERFALYFDQLIATIKENAEQVQIEMDRLQEKGINLKEQLSQIKGETRTHEEEVEERPKPKPDNRTFLERYIIDPVASFFGLMWDGLVAIVQWPYDLIFGSKKPEPVREIVAEEVTSEPEAESESVSEADESDDSDNYDE